MALNLQIVVVAEDLHKLARDLLGLVVALTLDHVRYLTTYASRHANQPLGMLAQQFLINAGIVVEALEITFRNELGEIAVASRVLGQ